MKMRNFFLLQLIIVSNCFGMDLIELNRKVEKKELPKLIVATVKNNNKDNNLHDLLLQFQQEQSIISRKKSNSSLLDEALNAADQNLESTKKQLSWLGNTSRQAQAGAGILEVLFGASKVGYDLFQFSLENTEIVSNIFDVVTDAILIRAGYYDIKLAWQNNSAKSEYLKAEMIKFMIATTAENLKKSSEKEDILDELEK